MYNYYVFINQYGKVVYKYNKHSSKTNFLHSTNNYNQKCIFHVTYSLNSINIVYGSKFTDKIDLKNMKHNQKYYLIDNGK